MKIVSIVFSLAMSLGVLANPNACDDYLARHYKKDLVIKSAQFFNRQYMGDIYYPHQVIKLKIKNQGQVDFNSSSSDDGMWRDLYVKLKGKEYKTRFKIPLDSSQETTVYFNVRPKTVAHCGDYLFEVDTKHTAHQWGCQVWNNDSKTVKTHQQGKFCRYRPDFLSEIE